jgi:hypothetical protein
MTAIALGGQVGTRNGSNKRGPGHGREGVGQSTGECVFQAGFQHSSQIDQIDETLAHAMGTVDWVAHPLGTVCLEWSNALPQVQI